METLLDGVDGAIGSAYRQETNQLFYVEYGGDISRFDSVRGVSSITTSGQTTLGGTNRFGLDSGTESPAADADIHWEQVDQTERYMQPMGDATIALLGDVSFGSVSHAELQQASYSDDPIDGSDGSNDLPDGTVFGVRTTAGNLAKVGVVDHGYDVEIQWQTYALSDADRVIGTGYTKPEDIALSSDGRHAFVTERGGALLKVPLDDADRSSATEVATGMTAPHQIALDESRGHAYVVEFAGNADGRLLRIDLTTGASTTVAAGLDEAVGLLVDDGVESAYVSEQAENGRVRRIELASGRQEVVVQGLAAPFFLEWADPDESAILTTERDPANRVSRVDLTDGSVSHLFSGVPFRPSSVARTSPDRLFVCSNDEITEVELDELYDASGPRFLGVGKVPLDRISADGYADTTGDPGYHFQVADAPFGGTLPLKVNHERAFEEGARYYTVAVDGTEPRQSWSEYRWSTSSDRFELRSRSAASGGYYRVKQPDELWYDHWLGYRLNTAGLTNGEHTVTIEFFEETNQNTSIGQTSVDLQIDNQRPRAQIEQIVHQHDTDGATPVGTCGIVDEGGDAFTFAITASDPEGHLRSWRLSAVWGDDKSTVVASDRYDDSTSGVSWSGLQNAEVPQSAWHAHEEGDPTSTRCAHTFYLRSWDRTINGEHHVHRTGTHQSMTIMLPESWQP